MSATNTVTMYDIDTHGCELVRAPFRVRAELRHAPPPHQCGWREPAAFTSDSVQLESFRATTVVSRPTHRIVLRDLIAEITGAKP